MTISRVHWPELDTLRGFAAVLMIVNHVSVCGPWANVAWAADMSFIGSFAPVLFFFLTGLGTGVQSVNRASSKWWLTGVKVGVLLAADSFLWVAPGRFIGMDFLGFIGVSMLILKCVECTCYSGVFAASAAVAIILLRFAVGPALRSWIEVNELTCGLGFLLGVTSISGFSYPPAPWLAFPFLGYTAGRLLVWCSRDCKSHSVVFWLFLVSGSSLSATVAAMLVLRGAILFRWGGVSAAFFIASLSVVGFTLAIVRASHAIRVAVAWHHLVALNGIQSFMIVPLHYAILHVMFDIIENDSVWSFLLILTIVLIASFAMSAHVLPIAARFDRFTRIGTAVVWVVVCTVAVGAFVGIATNFLPDSSRWVVRSGVQLMLCILLILPLPMQFASDSTTES